MSRSGANWIPLFVIILLASLFRFLYIDRLPTAISGDELIYPLTAKAVVQTGKDMTGTWNIWQALIFQNPPNQQQAELPYFLHIPLSYLFPLSLLTSHLPFACLSVGIVILLYVIALELLGKKSAWIIGLVAAVNPWLVVMGRTAYESTPATFFYLLALYLIIKLESWSLLWSIVPSLFAFYSYIGTKTILVPFMICSTFFSYILHKGRWRKQYIIAGISSIVITALFFVLIRTSNARTSDLLLPSSPSIASIVNEERKSSVLSPFTTLTINKYSVYIRMISDKLLQIFTLSYLFSKGDLFFPLQNHGFFYVIDAFFVALGALTLFAKKRLVFIFLTTMILIGTLPHILFRLPGDFSGHLAFMFPWFIFFIGYGVDEIVSIKNTYRIVLTIFVICAYIASISLFTQNYFFRHPLQDYGHFYMRVLSRYIVLLQRESKINISVYSNSSNDFFNKFLFYSNAITNSNIDASSTNIIKRYTLNNLNLFDCNKDIQIHENEIVIVDNLCDTPIAKPHDTISQLKDGGSVYAIYNDILCQNYQLKTYPNNLRMSDFLIEKLDAKTFCETYITKIN